MRVIETVADALGSDPGELQPLYDTIDPEALDRLLDGGTGRSPEISDRRIAFRFAGCDVTVHGDGRTVVSPPGDPDVS